VRLHRRHCSRCLFKASLCGHYEVVQLLLESGALCERDTFQGERCLYNALNDRIRNLLLLYDYSKSTDPLQPLAAHVTSLLSRDQPKTSDVTLVAANESFRLHKFLLAARSPYFAKKLAAAPDTTVWKLPNTIPSQSLQSAVRFLYLSEIADVSAEDDEEKEILTGVDKLSRTLEIERLFENIIEISDRRLMRQRRTDEVKRGQDELEAWFRENVVRHKIEVDTSKAADVKWDKNNGIFADVLLRADVEEDEEEDQQDEKKPVRAIGQLTLAPSIPIGPTANTSRSPSRTRKTKKSVLFPAHKAMLIRSEFFNTMFCSSFREAQETEYLQIIPIDCSPDVLEVILTFLYTEKSDFPLDVAIEVLFAADLLFIDKLKAKAAQIISTLGNGAVSIVESQNSRGGTDSEEILNIYDVIRAGWDTRVQRLEEFGARYIAQRLERYIDEEEFLELVQESASRVKARQETDTIELVDE
jgi:ankyrin repeat/BTB/POZ domain-containing protein 1